MKAIKDSKTKNSSRNIVFGFCLKIYQLLMPFIIRTIIIYVLGMEYAGLNSLFVSILSVLNIAELGVGTIMVFYMYKPIEEGDTDRICALMGLYKLYYRIIGLVILVIGICLTPFLPKLIKGDIPEDINLYILYFLNLGATVLSYWLFAYKNSLFQAHQRNDVVSRVTILTDTVKYILQISLLFIFKNYYYYVIALLITQVLNNIIIAKRADAAFPKYKPQGVLSKEDRKIVNSSIKDVFYGQLGLIITLSVDSIVISAFLGLVPLAQYQNYYFIINALISFFTIFYQSLRASIGTNIITKTRNENYSDFRFINFVVIGVLSFCAACLMNMFQPFIELWVGKENLLDDICVLLFVIYFLIYELSLLIGSYKDVSGKWHADRFRPLITALVNLTLNIIMVQVIGIYGILLSTIISFTFINIPWLFKRVFIDVFDYEVKRDYVKYLGKSVLVLIVVVTASTMVCRLVPARSLVVQLIMNFIVCCLVSVLLYSIFFKNSDEYKRAITMLGKIRRKVIKKVV